MLLKTTMHGPQPRSLGRASWAGVNVPPPSPVPGCSGPHCPLHNSPHTHLDGLVEDAGANLDDLQVLLLLVTCALDIGHPASVVLLAGIDKIAHCAILIEHLGAGE